MSTIAWALIGLPIAVGAYAYGVYPALLYLLGRRGAALPAAAAPDCDPWPMVTTVIAAFNEEGQIRGAIESQLAQDYPRMRRQILVLSDASTDRTDEIVREYARDGVELFRLPDRGGKTAAENASASLVRGDIVVATDASSRFHPATLRRLVGAMRDPRVGVVSGRDVSVSPEQSANVPEASYVAYEMWIRQLETRTGGTVGASGSGYAIRAPLHRLPLPAHLTRDFAAALIAHRHGFRTVALDDALCFVPRATSPRQEYRRKVRTISQGMATLAHERTLMDPMRHGLFAWKLVSHKLMRWLFPVSAVAGIAGLGIQARGEGWAVALLVGLGISALVAGVGMRWPTDRPIPRLVSVAAFGAGANVAVVHAAWRMLEGRRDAIWQPTRRPSAGTRCSAQAGSDLHTPSQSNHDADATPRLASTAGASGVSVGSTYE